MVNAQKIQARIISTGMYVPQKVLSNSDLEKMVETTDEWIYTRTGMKERRIASKEEHTSIMGQKAALMAIDEAKIAPEAIDFVIVCTLTPDYITPSTASIIQSELKLTNAAAIDVQAACTGLVYGLAMSKALVESGMYKNVLVIASEKLSTIVDYTDRNSCILFGDGAAAAIVSAKGKGLMLSESFLGSDGSLAELIYIPGGGSKEPACQESVAAKRHYLQLSGKEVFKHAVRRMSQAASDCLEKAGITAENLSWLVPHQANQRIIDAIAKAMSFPQEKVFVTIHKYGNTSASSIGIALHELRQEKELKNGENLMLVGFGAGLAWGAMILKQIDV